MNQRPLEEYIIGDSEPILELRRSILLLARSTLSVLIEGETGTGKELVARSLHSCSGRKGALVATNVCAISDSMFENEVFGHKRGAYTGAVSDSPGLLKEADGGTIFLDEIGGLGIQMQGKLLRAIELGEFRPVGGTRLERSTFRTVSATNDSLAGLVREGKFRADLHHRLGAIRIAVPSLDERREDIPRLVNHFANLHEPRSQRFGTLAMQTLQDMTWPGNVRELRNVVLMAMELRPGPIPAGFLRDLRRSAEPSRDLAAPAGSIERRRLLDALETHGWQKSETARSLGVHLATLYRQMKRLGVRQSTFG